MNQHIQIALIAKCCIHFGSALVHYSWINGRHLETRALKHFIESFQLWTMSIELFNVKLRFLPKLNVHMHIGCLKNSLFLSNGMYSSTPRSTIFSKNCSNIEIKHWIGFSYYCTKWLRSVFSAEQNLEFRNKKKHLKHPIAYVLHLARVSCIFVTMWNYMLLNLCPFVHFQ